MLFQKVMFYKPICDPSQIKRAVKIDTNTSAISPSPPLASPHSLLFASFFVSPLLDFFAFFSQVEDVNDNAPLTSDPIYHPVVMENSPKDVSVIHIQAQDPDLTATPSRLSYRITAGNPQNFFSINPKTGKI